MANILTKLWGIDWKETIAHDHWVQAKLIGHEIQGVDFLVGSLHRVANWGQRYFDETNKFLD
jgi:hypothetical protein